MTVAEIEERKQFCSEVAMLKHKAGELGMFRTMHALEAGVTEVGYELADQIEKGKRDEKSE